MQPSIRDFLDPNLPREILDEGDCKTCSDLAMLRLWNVIGTHERVFTCCGIKNKIQESVKNTGHHWVEVRGDSLRNRTKFVSQANRAHIYPVTFACITLDLPFSEVFCRISELGSCMYMDECIVCVKIDKCTHVVTCLLEREGSRCHVKITSDEHAGSHMIVKCLIFFRTNRHPW